MHFRLLAAVLAFVPAAAFAQDQIQVQGGNVVVKSGGQTVEVNGGDVKVRDPNGANVTVKNSKGKKVKVTAPVAPAVPVAAPSSEPLLIDGNDRKFEGDCSGRDVDIVGNDNKVKLTGVCRAVSVSGNDQVVELEAAESIDVTGNQNKVSYARDIQVGRPTPVNTAGSDNKVVKLAK